MKRVLTSIITSLILASFLLATNGLSLVQHYCSAQNQSQVFLFSQDADCSNCENHHEQSCHEDLCSHAEASDCCKNTNQFIKLIADYFSSSNDTDTDCPIFNIEHSSTLENLKIAELPNAYLRLIAEDVGVPEQLLIKQTTEFLL
ncbi:MAG: hypothetical protein LBU91_04190 [Bacteroidales bacterium]|jgi:hypothetical protein|nr:hypothetical protein [Bacteroidales bacterium]